MDKQDARRGKITPENLDEARKLKALWEGSYEHRKRAGLHSQGSFGAQYEIGNQAAVGFFLNGKTALSAKAAAGFARGLGCSVADFSPRLADELAALCESITTTNASTTPSNPPAAVEPGDLDQALETIGIKLAAATTDKREAIATNLAGWAREGGADHWRQTVFSLLSAPPAAGKRYSA